MKFRIFSSLVATASICRGFHRGSSVKPGRVSKPGGLLVSLVMILFIPHHAKVLAEDKPLFDEGAIASAPGYEVFMKYCAGCHGFDGFALYEHAPSVALGERMQKSDQELLNSVLYGKHGMPYWQDKLSVDMIRSAIAYLREMAQRYRSGLPPRQRPIPETYYRFNPVGEGEDYWFNWERKINNN